MFEKLSSMENLIKGVEYSLLSMEGQKFNVFKERENEENVLAQDHFLFKYQFITSEILIFKVKCGFIFYDTEQTTRMCDGYLTTSFHFKLINQADIVCPSEDLRIFIGYLTVISYGHLRAYKEAYLAKTSFADLVLPVQDLGYYHDRINQAVGTQFWSEIK